DERRHPMERWPSSVTEFVGREEELTVLRARLDQACAGAGGIALLSGGPGIGKTPTAGGAASGAGPPEGPGPWGGGDQGRGAPAFWPWIQVIRAYGRERDATRLSAELGTSAADVAQLVPELRQRLPDVPPHPPLEGAQARFRLFESVTGFLRAAAERQPLLLVLDDLHWVDRPSLLLLEFLSREIHASRLLVLGTYRDVEVARQHPLARTIAELARSRTTEHLALRGLGEAEVAQFIELVAGRQPPTDMVVRVLRETDGNPFFV